MLFRPFCHLADKMIRKCGRQYPADRVDYEYIEIVEELADIFQVSKSAVEVWLKQPGYIQKEALRIISAACMRRDRTIHVLSFFRFKCQQNCLHSSAGGGL